ncbi:uncharacterized protein B0I36DRAFT_359970 [Microdochium trichocladiopsis]|uniref:Uncharacterized protein n=1 Tax=Microdochium trichocladiopsis TaxID=1682393 RepID=A0A9P9BV86_9PEZI|nr:uncharacterized protein B0I36DRAFT_359970 [Microdochium trichocladiopsis]KAH7038396.1 hypothetical protein B0I36DRAFT_359970 [Microdochium trichocladiopsis]
MGPFVGGVLVEINLPLGGVALVSLLPFLRVKYNRTTTISERLKRIDYISTLVLVGAVTSVLIGLSYGGTLYAWSNARIIGVAIPTAVFNTRFAIEAYRITDEALASITPAAVGFALVFMEKEVVLRTELDTKFGLEDGQKGGSGSGGGGGSSDVESDAAAGAAQVKEKTSSA